MAETQETQAPVELARGTYLINAGRNTKMCAGDVSKVRSCGPKSITTVGEGLYLDFANGGTNCCRVMMDDAIANGGHAVVDLDTMESYRAERLAIFTEMAPVFATASWGLYIDAITALARTYLTADQAELVRKYEARQQAARDAAAAHYGWAA